MNSLVNDRRRGKGAGVSPASLHSGIPQIPRQKRTQEERSTETQAALVEAAISMLCEVGFAGTTTVEVARRAGCTTGAMQHHFGSKNQLMLALMRRLTDEFEATTAGFEALVARPLSERCAKVVQALAGYYCAPRYVAIWELYVGSRCDRALNEICIANRARAMAHFEKAWLTVFADVSASRQDVLALMDFAVTYLRNFGLNALIGTTTRSPSRQLAFLQSALEQQMQARGARSSSTRPVKTLARRRQA